jgi:simple sugar transport system ATP-binding protein
MGTGVAPGLPIRDNIILKSYREPHLRTGPVLRWERALDRARELMKRFDIKARSPTVLARQLSGGNVQKVLLARELSAQPKVVVAASPTRGLDVSATEGIRRALVEAIQDRVAVLLITEDLDELLDLSDRIAVIYEGRIIGVLDSGRVNIERIGLMMAGMKT